MNLNYVRVIACFLLIIAVYDQSTAQTSGPEFLDCSSVAESLCIKDEGVWLPVNNKLYLGEAHPDATSCFVHVTQKKRVRSNCGGPLQYEVQLFIHDTSSAYVLKPFTVVATDSLGEAELTFNTTEAVDELVRSSGLSYGTGCLSYHRIKWIVTDSCGSSSTCEQTINLYDCSPVEAVASSSPFIIIIPIGCQISRVAKDFYAGGLDDCGLSDQFDYSFEEERYNPDTMIYCPPAYGVEIPWKIWIADAGSDRNCDGQIEWAERTRVVHPFNVVFIDNVGVCCEPEFDYVIIGKITTVDGYQGINQVHVSLLRPGSFFPTYITGPSGHYSFGIVLTGEVTTIKPEKNDGHRNGVSTLDLVKIQKHLLGRDTFTSPYQYIAADVNNSQNVSAIDMVELRKLILGKYQELPSNKSWRFFAVDSSSQDTIEPWSYAETISFTNTLPANADFYGIKIGDINGTARPNLNQLFPRQSYPSFELNTNNQMYGTGDILYIPIRISSDQNLTGFQFTLAATGMKILNILPGKIPIEEEHYAIFNDMMSISWFDESTIDIKAEEILFTVQLHALKPGNIRQALSINSAITDAEIYLANEETFLPVLNFQTPNAVGKPRYITCAPNPWQEETTVSFNMSEPDRVLFTVYDASGHEIRSSSEYLPQGFQQYPLKSSDFQSRGIVFLKVSSSKYSEIIKLIVLE